MSKSKKPKVPKLKIPKLSHTMLGGVDTKSAANILRLLDTVEARVGGPVLYFDGNQLLAHPDLITEVLQPENLMISILLSTFGEVLREHSTPPGTVSMHEWLRRLKKVGPWAVT